MLNAGVAKILQTGLFGFIFLMAFLAVHALRDASRAGGKGSGDAAIRSARTFLWTIVVLVALAGGFDLLNKWLFEKGSPEALVECRNSVSRLETLSQMPGVDAAKLKAQIAAHVALCEEPLKDATAG